MKKRLLAIFLAVVMAVSLLSVMAFADGEEPTEPEGSAETETLDEPEESEDPAESDETEKSEDPEESEEPADPNGTEEPEKSEDPAESDETEESEEPADSDETEEPEESEDPAESEEPGESEEPETPEITFSDVDANEFYASAVQWAAENGFIKGTGDGSTFSPNMYLTRGMVYTILARVDGTDTTPEAGSAWYEKGMDWAVENGISDGENAEADISLEQLVTMLWRYMDSPETDASVLDDFSDKDSVSGWAVDGMAWAVEVDLVRGNDDGTLTPGNGLQRWRGAVVLQRFCENVLETELGE